MPPAVGDLVITEIMQNPGPDVADALLDDRPHAADVELGAPGWLDWHDASVVRRHPLQIVGRCVSIGEDSP